MTRRASRSAPAEAPDAGNRQKLSETTELGFSQRAKMMFKLLKEDWPLETFRQHLTSGNSRGKSER
jgi:hypothetical protein